MPQDSQPTSKNSIKTAIIYLFLVCLIVIFSIILRLFFLILHASYDTQHQFIISIQDRSQKISLIVFNPDNHTIKTCKVDGVVSPKRLAGDIGVPIDGSITNYPKDLSSVSSLMQFVLIHFDEFNPPGINLVDAFRLLLFSRSIKQSDIASISLHVPVSSDEQNQKLHYFFQDKTIFSEGLTISIVNATGQSGIGNKMGKLLQNIGANVIAVDTAESEQEETTISYSGFGGYTLKKIARILHKNPEKVAKTGFSDIIITIGKRSLSESIF